MGMPDREHRELDAAAVTAERRQKRVDFEGNHCLLFPKLQRLLWNHDAYNRTTNTLSAHVSYVTTL